MAWYIVTTKAHETYNKTEVRITPQDCRLYFGFIVNHLKTKGKLFYLKTQFAPRSKLFSSRL